MAPPLEYDKEPKAPDKSATTISNEDSKLLHNIVNDQQPNPDHKPANTAANTEVENKQVVNLDDGQLRALLDEAMNYKCPKDLEGKSNLFKELLEEVQQDDQQDDQASSAASRGAARARRGGGGARGRSQLLQSNSLQDLVAALAAEPAPRRHARHHTPAHPPAPVSARAIQGGSLPSGVDTSFLMGEEPAGRGAGYLATVRCVNPPPLAERRVSASDANGPQELESLHRRSKPVFPMTYTARATLEIGSGAVCSGRAVTTTTASNQVRTRHPTCGPPARIYPPAQPSGRTESRPHQTLTKRRPRSAEEAPKKDKRTTSLKTEKMTDANQRKLMSALCARGSKVSDRTYSNWESEEDKPRGPSGCGVTPRRGPGASRRACGLREARLDLEPETELWKNDVDRWYDGVAAYQDQFYQMQRSLQHGRNQLDDKHRSTRPTSNKIQTNEKLTANTSPNIDVHNIALGNRICDKPKINIINPNKVYDPIISANQVKYVPKKKTAKPNTEASLDFHNKNNKNNRKLHRVEENLSGTEQSDIRLRKICREKVPSKILENPRNIRSMTISKTPNVAFSEVHQSTDVKETVNTNIRNANPKNVYAPIISADQIKYVSKKKTAKPNTEASLDFQKDKNNKVHKLCSIEENLSDTEESDIRLRKIYRDRVGNVVPSVTLANPRNIRSLTISKTPNVDYSEVHQSMDVKETVNTDICNVKNTRLSDQTLKRTEQSTESCPIKSDILKVKIVETIVKDTLKYDSKDSREPLNNCKEIEMEMIKPPSIISESEVDIEQTVDVSNTKDKDDSDSFVKFCIAQQKLFQIIESTNEEELLQPFHNSDNKEAKKLYNEELFNKEAIPEEHNLELELKELKTKDDISHQDQNKKSANVEENNNESSENANIDEVIFPLNKKPQDQDSKDQYILAELSNNAYVFLTLPKRLLTASHNKDVRLPVQLREVDHNTSPLPGSVEVKAVGKVTSKKKKDKVLGPNSDAKKKDAINKNALKVLLFENLKRDVSVKPGTSIAGNEGDSAIPFSCITTPEVVASCNTTASTPQSTVAVDPKPLQLGSGYRAVASLTGAGAGAGGDARDEPRADDARQLQVFVPRLGLQPRSVISSSFNGLPLTRPGYGAAPDEYKKSLDENGNAVQGFSSPVSGSSQHKKPRRKKSSRNETVIKSDQIDGYKGDKDLNEVLRFIESDAEHGRGKLGRAKHDDDKAKKRSAERRKDKDKPKRASSLEELSRTKLEDLTEPRAPPAAAAAAKPERRSWGDDARSPFYYRAPTPTPAAPPELTDFQTVTKRRKPRRRADEPERDREPPRRPRPPEPRSRRESAPPSDRSNDSNDDQDSVTSLPAPAPPAPAPASYADIARTRHNIPDLIESCNYYAEGEAEAGEPAGGAAGDADYPALGVARRPAKAPPRRERKGAPAAKAECPAPDVVADRRPPVILLDSAARPRDMDGVTFGFDINEQLLGGGGPARRPRCDLVRDALDPPRAAVAGVAAVAPVTAVTAVPAVAPVAPHPGTTVLPGAPASVVPAGPAGPVPVAAAPAAGTRVRVGAGCAALRYVAPAPPSDTRHLHQLVDYVGSAWEDVVRCGGGKVRYFSE